MKCFLLFLFDIAINEGNNVFDDLLSLTFNDTFGHAFGAGVKGERHVVRRASLSLFI